MEKVDTVNHAPTTSPLNSKTPVKRPGAWILVGQGRPTVAKYTAKAEAEGYVPGGVPLPVEGWAILLKGWFPELVDPRSRSLTHEMIDAHRAEIAEMLKTNKATTVHQRLRDEAGLNVSVSSFRRYLWREFPEDNLRSMATPPRPEVPPGEEAQVDYGYLGTWFDPMADRTRRVWAFVLVLAHSRHMFVRPVLTMDQRTWTACHIEAFEFFAGAPRCLVSDNLKTGVIKPDIYDPLLNRSYADLATYYGCLVDPARSLKPKDNHEDSVIPMTRGVVTCIPLLVAAFRAVMTFLDCRFLGITGGGYVRLFSRPGERSSTCRSR